MSDLAKLKICFLAGTLGQGGAERQLYYMLKALKQSGASPRLLCLNRGEFWEGKIRELGVPVTWVGQQEAKLVRLARIVAVLGKDCPDILQSQHTYTNLYAVAAARILGSREVGAVRGDAMRETRAYGQMGFPSLRIPRVIAANSRLAIRNAIKFGVPAAHFHFLPNVVDTGQFKPVTRHKTQIVRLVTVGRLIELKRLDRFLSILARVRQDVSEVVKGVIVGDGPLRKQLERQASEMGLLPGGVEFKGSIQDVSPIYQEGDIFVLTSESEGTPNVILEAMASSLPIVATQVGDVPDIVQHGKTGYLVSLGDENFMVNALLKLVKEPHLRMDLGCRAREYVKAHHSLCQLPAYLENLYGTVLS